MLDKFESIIKHIIGSESGDNPLSGINISDHFHPEKSDSLDIKENLNSAFLILLAGKSHALYDSSDRYFTKMESMPEWKETVDYYRSGLELIASEILSLYNSDTCFKNSINDLCAWFDDPANKANEHETVDKVRDVFFPEGTGLHSNRDDKITELRNNRVVDITSLNPLPITDPVRQMVFTSNILITTPIVDVVENSPLNKNLALKLKSIITEDQLFWYDHPIPIGIAAENNEILYGLEGLDRAVAFEKERGTIDNDSKLTCLLSVSVTHKGLQQVAKQYLEDELNNEKNISHLEVYVFTESDTQKIIEDILIPAAERCNKEINPVHLSEVFGVDGEYGRHYSFLKAIAAFWQVFINPEIKGTFKIDLDQMFPQEQLLEQSGFSAFEHFKTPLWGAKGRDSEGNPVELGMIAGALVNQKDIDNSLYFPDVSFPENKIKADELIFQSNLPQALSTESEMMTRYAAGKRLDGKSRCIQRIHVTGGTNGILLDALRRYRPFTPTIIGRAEDQAYILSVLFNDHPDKLRYLHKDGLIMRHDKEAFAVEAIKKATTGKLIGDYIRILLFSFYTRALPWSFEKIKKQVDPFTGCFISKIPLTVVYLRFALKTALFFADTSDDKKHQGKEFMDSGIKRLSETISYLNQNPNPLVELYKKEKSGWDMFYDILDKTQSSIMNRDAFASELRNKASSIIKSCKVKI